MMGEKSKPCSFNVLNVGTLLFMLYIVGSTPRFMVISLTLISWLQTKWLEYTSFLEKRRSARLAAAADEVRIQRRKQIADITESIGDNVISLLDKSVRDRELEIENREKALQALQKRLEEREQKVKAAEDRIRKIKLEKVEFKAQNPLGVFGSKVTSDSTPGFGPTSRSSGLDYKPAFGLTSGFGSAAPSLITFTLPSDLLEYAKDLNSDFTCVGVTKKGARCRQNFISSAHKSYAADRIAKMKSSDPGDTFELNALRELADWMLCPRWHRDTLPQGGTIAKRWYNELRDAREKLKSQTQKHANPWTSVNTPSSAITSSSTSSSVGVPSVFSSKSTGTASSVASVQSVSTSYTGSSHHFMSTQGATAAAPETLFKDPAARNLTPLFQAMAQQ
ncbi:hypothetical protein BGW36DRAFT_139198 [Talaromyces proteolyticus]|uniref:Uncharacterized protein n=1 Tax=Talaromyces proteolyticus TaxID=1131652 RepID=A0AAD4KXG9_9EURO|nr:uncharacterized protein BGW36DRAFT_139198 [Talaromyces proteolyticus]KAH8700997.1 hypothetical protein BGW36DRAFT_139198 [Talaromyces proteolyticus]